MLREETQPLVIVSAGAFGREVACMVEQINAVKPQWNLLGLVDNYLTTGCTIEGHRILGPVSILDKMELNPWLVIAIGDPTARKQLAGQLSHFKFATLIHPSVIHGDLITVGKGSIICAGTIITTNVTIGEHCIVNLGCRIGHDSCLGDFASLMPGVNLAGNVVVREGCYFGLNACVMNNTTIGKWSKVGMGAVVIKDIPPRTVSVTTPSRILKSLD
jgi:sugar O-acyltransferase (sialic acid O-acetyltransferase NeuD family)